MKIKNSKESTKKAIEVKNPKESTEKAIEIKNPEESIKIKNPKKMKKKQTGMIKMGLRKYQLLLTAINLIIKVKQINLGTIKLMT